MKLNTSTVDFFVVIVNGKSCWRQEVIAHRFKKIFFSFLGYIFAFFPGEVLIDSTVIHRENTFLLFVFNF